MVVKGIWRLVLYIHLWRGRAFMVAKGKGWVLCARIYQIIKLPIGMTLLVIY